MGFSGKGYRKQQSPVSYGIVLPLQDLLDKGMPINSWQTTSGTADGVELVNESAKFFKVQPGHTIYVPWGWVCQTVAVLKKEVKLSDTVHHLHQPLLDSGAAKDKLTTNLLKEVIKWNKAGLRELSGTSDSWLAASTLFDSFATECGYVAETAPTAG